MPKTHPPRLLIRGAWVFFCLGVSSCSLFRAAPVPPVQQPEGVFQDVSEELPPPVAPRNLRQDVVAEAEKYLGIPYIWAGKSPQSGFDCSGFTAYVLKQFGLSLSPSAREQARLGQAVPLDQVRPGDFLFFRNDRGEVFHVSLIRSRTGNALEVIHSVRGGVTKEDIRRSSWWMKHKMEARALLPMED